MDSADNQENAGDMPGTADGLEDVDFAWCRPWVMPNTGWDCKGSESTAAELHRKILSRRTVRTETGEQTQNEPDWWACVDDDNGRKEKRGTNDETKTGAAVRTALLANIGVAVAKMLAAVFTGSSAMMSESVHSLADCANEIVLIVGRKLSVRRDDRHPFGLFRVKYLAGFLVATLLFLVGGLYSTVEAWGKLTACLSTPGREPVSASSMLVVLAIVAVSAVLEAYGLHGSFREAGERMRRTETPRQPMPRFWRETKSAELASTLMEDTLALIGLLFAGLGAVGSLVSGDALWDALGGLMVGVTLICGSLLLAWKNGSLLVGEGMEPLQAAKVRAAVSNTVGVNRLLEMQAVHTGEDSVLLCLKIETSKLDRDFDVETVDKVERNVRSSLPWYRFEIYVEPDVFDARRGGLACRKPNRVMIVSSTKAERRTP